MTEEYELAAFDRHSLNFDNVALGRLPTNVTTDPSVQPLRELAYLPEGVIDPHDVPATQSRAGQLPEERLELLKMNSKNDQATGSSQTNSVVESSD